jgi:hypothetical protein
MLELVIAVGLVFVNASDGDTLVVRDGNVKTVLRLARVQHADRFSSALTRELLVE